MIFYAAAADLFFQLFTTLAGAATLLTLTITGFIMYGGRKVYRRATVVTDDIVTLIETIEGLKIKANNEINKMNRFQAWMLNRKLKKRGIICSTGSSD